MAVSRPIGHHVMPKLGGTNAKSLASQQEARERAEALRPMPSLRQQLPVYKERSRTSASLFAWLRRLATDDAYQRVLRAGRMPRSLSALVIASSVVAPVLRIASMTGRRPDANWSAASQRASARLFARLRRLATDEAYQRVPRAGRMPRSLSALVIASSVVALEKRTRPPN